VTEARLRAGGGRKVHYLSGLVTHCVAGAQPDQAEVAEAEELLELPVVTEEWVRLSSRCGEALPVRGFRVGGGQLFSGVVVRVVGLGRGDEERIWAMVTWHGGKVVAEAGIVTHLVTGEVGASCKSESKWTVTPDWVLDSVKMGRRVDEVNYNTDMVIVPSRKNNQPVPLSAMFKLPVVLKSKYQKPSSSSRSLPSMPTVIAALVNTSQEDRCNHDEASSPLQPQKLSFSLADASILSEDRNGNRCRVEGKGRLESITEGEELEDHENGNIHKKKLLCSSLEDVGKELESIDTVVDDLAMVNIHDNEIGGPELTEEVNVCPPKDEGKAIDVLRIGLNKRNQPCAALTGPKKELADKSKRRKSVRLAGKQADILSGSGESSVGISKACSAVKEVSKPVQRAKEPGLPRKFGKQVSVDVVKVPVKVKQQMSVDIVKDSKDLLRIPKGSKKTPGDLNKDSDHDLPKVVEEKVSRRRSVRLQEKPLIDSDKGTRRRSTRHMSSDYLYY